MCRTVEKAVRPSLQVGVRSYAESTSTAATISISGHSNRHSQRQGSYASLSLPSHSHHALHRRYFSQSIPILSSATAELRPSISPTRRSTRTRGRSKPKSRSSKDSTTPPPPPPQKRTEVHPTGPNILPMQSTHTTRILWQSIAPHVEFRTLQELNKHLSRIISRGHHAIDILDRDGMDSTLRRRLNMMFGGKGGKAPEKQKNLSLSADDLEVNVEYTWSAKGHPVSLCMNLYM